MPEPLEVRVLRLESWVEEFSKKMLPNLLEIAKQIEDLAEMNLGNRECIKLLMKGKK